MKRKTSANYCLIYGVLTARQAAEIYADLRKAGQAIGHTDCLIAGIALTNGLQLVTNNTDHFKRVKGLEIINWLH